MSDINDKLYNLLDGDLPPEQETELFSALQSDKSLREELKDQLSIRTAVNSDKRAFVPSPDSTAALMGKLGFTGGAAAGVGAASSVATKPLYLKYLSTVLFSVASAVVGYVLGTEIFFSGQSGQTGETISQVQTDTVYADYPTTSSRSGAAESTESKDFLARIDSLKNIIASHNNNSFAYDSGTNSNPSNQFTSPQSSIRKYVGEISRLENTITQLKTDLAESTTQTQRYLNEAKRNSETNAQLQSDIVSLNEKLADNAAIISALKDNQTNTNTENSLNPTTDPPINSSANPDFASVPNILMPNIPLTYLRGSGSGNGMSIYLMGSVYAYQDQPKVAPAEYPIFNNMGIGYSYELFQKSAWNFEALAEFRKETYATRYPIRIGDPNSPMATQQPNYNTFTIGARANYVIDNQDGFRAFNFFADATAGIAFSADVLAVGGSVVRPRAGVEWYMSPGNYLFAAYDISLLNFRQDANDYTSTKNGLSIGLGLDF